MAFAMRVPDSWPLNGEVPKNFLPTIDCERVEEIREDGSAGTEQNWSDIIEDKVNRVCEVFDVKLLEGRFLNFSINDCLDCMEREDENICTNMFQIFLPDSGLSHLSLLTPTQ